MKQRMMVSAGVRKETQQREYWFDEGCYIIETANDAGDEILSIARARVLPGTATAWHLLEGVAERYIIVAGTGVVEVGEEMREEVAAGDVVRIPAHTRQRITNCGDDDLVFYAVCSPPFTSRCYVALPEDDADRPVRGDGRKKP